MLQGIKCLLFFTVWTDGLQDVLKNFTKITDTYIPAMEDVFGKVEDLGL